MNKYIDVKEYSKLEGITQQGAYKRIKNGQVNCLDDNGKKMIEIEEIKFKKNPKKTKSISVRVDEGTYFKVIKEIYENDNYDSIADFIESAINNELERK